MPQQVPIVPCVIIWGAVATFIIVLVEILRSHASQSTRRQKPIRLVNIKIWENEFGHNCRKIDSPFNFIYFLFVFKFLLYSNNRTPWIIVELYRHFGFFTLGALTTLLFTELAKYTIGRLRPHYLTVCGPKLTDDLCKDEFGYQKFVEESEDEICENLKDGTYTHKQLHEARLSFLSGHSSFSFYCGMFLIIYLQARLNNFPRMNNPCLRRFVRAMKIIRPFLQFGMIILSFWISLTRISDYFHHPLDVIMGAIVGISFAIITLIVIGDIFTRRSSFWKSLKCKTGHSVIVNEPNISANHHPEGWLLQPIKK